MNKGVGRHQKVRAVAAKTAIRVKMDIEGAERNALRGGRAVIRRFRPRLALSAYHLPDDRSVLRTEVKAAFAGYHLYCEHARLKAGGILHSRIAPMVYFFQA